MLAELHRLVESGRLDPEWFSDLITYETRFRIRGYTHAQDGHSRAAVAADLLRRLDTARQGTALLETDGADREGTAVTGPRAPSPVVT